MKARTFKSIEDGVYKVSIYTEDWSENDIGLMIKYDEPEINLGGSFSGAISYTLPDQYARIRNESPFTVSFDSRDDDPGTPTDTAEVRADIWATAILSRLETEITTLRSHTDDFTSESVVVI